MKKFFEKKRMMLGICLICSALWQGAALADETEETEIMTEQAAEKLPEDGVLYYDLENEEKGAIILIEEDGKFYIQNESSRTDVTETESEFESESESGEEPGVSVFETPEAFYATTALYMRALPDTQSEIVQTLDIEQKITVYGEMNEKWFLAGTEKGYGFVAKKYLTDSEQEAEQAKQAEEAARRAAEIAAQQAAQQAAAQQAASQKKSSSGKVEVSRESIPNCDDDSHGTTYITYSDGSVKAVNY